MHSSSTPPTELDQLSDTTVVQETSEHRTQLDLHDIHCRIDTTSLLSNVNASLTGKGISAIMGFNGAGKSMLLKVMHGLVEPSSGSVLWNSLPADKAHLKSQSMVFQKPVLLRRSTKANIDFVLKARNTRDPERRDELLERVGLVDKGNLPARLLSGGEQQRLALARALAVNPSVLFLDEATASLDPASTAIIERIVSEQANAGTKVIMVTHDAAQAARLAQQIIFLDSGTVVEQQTSDDFFTAPTSMAAQAYLDGRIYNPTI